MLVGGKGVGLDLGTCGNAKKSNVILVVMIGAWIYNTYMISYVEYTYIYIYMVNILFFYDALSLSYLSQLVI